MSFPLSPAARAVAPDMQKPRMKKSIKSRRHRYEIDSKNTVVQSDRGVRHGQKVEAYHPNFNAEEAASTVQLAWRQQQKTPQACNTRPSDPYYDMLSPGYSVNMLSLGDQFAQTDAGYGLGSDSVNGPPRWVQPSEQKLKIYNPPHRIDGLERHTLRHENRYDPKPVNYNMKRFQADGSNERIQALQCHLSDPSCSSCEDRYLAKTWR